MIVSGGILTESTLASDNVTLDFDIVDGTAEAVVWFVRNKLCLALGVEFTGMSPSRPILKSTCIS